MPVYDPDPDYFGQAVDSILHQTLHDLELLIVEDPSPRSAAALLATRIDPRVRHLLRPHKGTLVDSLNWGLAEARAPWIARADADDVCEPDRLEKQLAFLREHPDIDVLGSQLAMIDREGKPSGYRSYPLQHEAIVHGMMRYSTLAHPSVCFKKEQILAAGGYRRFFNEDYELWSRLVGQGVQFANHPEALVRYRLIPDGGRTGKVREALRGTLQVKQLYWLRNMDLGAKLRMWTEHALLWLPQSLVLFLFIKTQCRARPPVAR
jgi:glycosyltransferase involved in cell wall biosynthesis